MPRAHEVPALGKGLDLRRGLCIPVPDEEDANPMRPQLGVETRCKRFQRRLITAMVSQQEYVFETCRCERPHDVGVVCCEDFRPHMNRSRESPERVSGWRGRYDGCDERVIQRSGDAPGIDTGAEIVFAEREVGSGLLHAAREDEDRRGAGGNGITKFRPRVVFQEDAGGTLSGARGGRKDEARADESKKSRSERRLLLRGVARSNKARCVMPDGVRLSDGTVMKLCPVGYGESSRPCHCVLEQGLELVG